LRLFLLVVAGELIDLARGSCSGLFRIFLFGNDLFALLTLLPDVLLKLRLELGESFDLSRACLLG